jgi:RNA polymerase sigma factor (sigma-70 family)
MSRTDAAVLQAIAAERDYLLRFALQRLRNSEQSEDAVQSALARAVSGARRFAGRSSLRTWLTSILRNAIVDAQRARAREPLLADLVARTGASPEQSGGAWDPAEILQARQLAEAMSASVQRLPAESARAFVMRELEGRSGPEIQARLGMSPGRYWQALHRARKTLRSLHALSLFTGAAMAVVLAAAGWSLPASAQEEQAASYLPRHKPRLQRTRPVVAVVAHNASTELTDYVVPYGILAESGVAEVLAIATQGGAIEMSPALRFRAQASIREFDARFPQGADYVIVPNVYEGQHDAQMLAWVRTQAGRGATIVGICDGVPVLANAGLLEGRRATGHWKTVPELERKHPQTRWLRNRRYVADGNVITTSGVSASIPVSVALVEAIGGWPRAEQVARSLGVGDWSPMHDSEQFELSAGSLFTALRNKAMFWRHEALGVEVAPGVDEIAVALVADAYGRTRRSSAVSLAQTSEPVRTRRGLLLLPDRSIGGAERPDATLPLFETLPAALALERSLEGIAARYGENTAAFVALTMEYPWKHSRR